MPDAPEQIGPVTLTWHDAAVALGAPATAWPAVLDALRGAGLRCDAQLRPSDGGCTLRTRLTDGVSADTLRQLVRDAAGVPAEEAPVEAEPVVVPGPVKGHWKKGRSRNLDPSRVAVGKVLADLLRRAIESGWRHPAHGPLSTRKVGACLGVDHSTVAKWCRGENLPPLWALDELRALLRDYHP